MQSELPWGFAYHPMFVWSKWFLEWRWAGLRGGEKLGGLGELATVKEVLDGF